MLNYLVPHMRKSKAYKEIFDAEGIQITQLGVDIDDIKAQLSVSTATWALDIYEKELGIVTDILKSYSDRRSLIISKLRGNGKLDRTLIKITADAYTNGNVTVTFNDNILIQFSSSIGTPPNIEDLKAVLESIKPAYLGITYSYRYLFISEIVPKTIAQMSVLTLSNFAGGS